jgi:hypothetical protein
MRSSHAPIAYATASTRNRASCQRYREPRGRLAKLSGPGGGAESTSQGRPYTIFRRALERRNLLVAEANSEGAASAQSRRCARPDNPDRAKDSRRHPRVAARWLLRYLEECDDATIDEAAMVAACLSALAGDRHRDAALTLRAMAEERQSASNLRRSVSAGQVVGSVLGVRLAARPYLRSCSRWHEVGQYVCA